MVYYSPSIGKDRVSRPVDISATAPERVGPAHCEDEHDQECLVAELICYQLFGSTPDSRAFFVKSISLIVCLIGALNDIGISFVICLDE